MTKQADYINVLDRLTGVNKFVFIGYKLEITIEWDHCLGKPKFCIVKILEKYFL